MGCERLEMEDKEMGEESRLEEHPIVKCRKCGKQLSDNEVREHLCFTCYPEHPLSKFYARQILKRVCGFCGGSGVVKVNEHKKVWCQICRGQGFKIVRR